MGGDGYTLRPEDLRLVMRRYLEWLHRHREALNRLNVYPVPDGDTGTNMALTVESVVAETDRAGTMAEVGAALAHGSLMGAQGNSGIILSEILRGFAVVLESADTVDSRHLSDALQRASAAAYQAVGRPVEGTILTVLRVSAEAADEHGGDVPEPLPEFLGRVFEAGGKALQETPDLLPVLKEAGVVDAGGAGYLMLLAAFLEYTTGDEAALPAGVLKAAAVRVGAQGHTPDEADVSDLRYEVMFLLDGAGDAGERLMASWRPIGDSIVVVGGDGTWNCHIHTDEIGAAVEAGIEAGRPYRIQITDLLEQAEAEAFHRESGFEPTSEAASADVGVVAAVVGRGVIELFRDGGVQGVVVGGQTMNPSVRDLLDVVEAVPARTVIVLPNNKNVVPAAEQLDNLTKKRVVVVPTTSIPQGVAALIEYVPTATDADVVAEAMSDAAALVTTAEVTRAVRDATTPAGAIRQGDWLGIVDGAVKVIVPGRPGAARRLLDGSIGLLRGAAHRERAAARRAADGLTSAMIRLLGHVVGADAELVTVIAGAEADDVTTAAMERWLGEHRDEATVEMLDGGQPLYPYVVGVE